MDIDQPQPPRSHQQRSHGDQPPFENETHLHSHLNLTIQNVPERAAEAAAAIGAYITPENHQNHQ